MKAMISQPMNGRTNEQIRKERVRVTQQLEDLGWIVLDTIFAEEPPQASNMAVYYLSESIKALSEADAVLFMNGWEKARGCQIEHDICLKYDVPTMYEYEL